MKKDKKTSFRWQKKDFVFIEKRAGELKITLSEYLRLLIKKDLKGA